MNKKIIALAVAAAAFGTSVSAVELYNKDGSTFKVGGHVSMGVTDSEQTHATVDSRSPRINFEATQDVGNGFTATAKAEWAMNMLDGGDNTFTTRLGQVGLSHDVYGSVVGGTQWAPYYDAAGVADLPIAFANDFIYDNHGALGTGRGDAMVTYRNGLELGNAGNLNLGLGWQSGNEITDGDNTLYNTDVRTQAVLGYDVAGFGVNYAYNTGNVSDTASFNQTATSHLVSAKYGTYGKGLYVAGVYAMNDYMNSGNNGQLLEDTKAYEAILAYGLSNSLNLSVNYEAVKNDGDTMGAGYKGETMYATTAIQAEYDVNSRLRAYAGYEFDLEGTGQYKDDNTRNNIWTAGIRFYL
ncbi:porin [Vibrio sp. ZSDZ34]|uniref:Porin n=1 Tax=Vibrio gelatinilyticus TaxID=2893468 RepID=A0A9X2AVC6_9VIBR|nr:porin [Vibrio gelatinilyticus]MCJ2376240.1 porin [Vibrio gelatinilyticus]